MTELQRLRDEGWRADGERDEVRLVRGDDEEYAYINLSGFSPAEMNEARTLIAAALNGELVDKKKFKADVAEALGVTCTEPVPEGARLWTIERFKTLLREEYSVIVRDPGHGHPVKRVHIKKDAWLEYRMNPTIRITAENAVERECDRCPEKPMTSRPCPMCLDLGTIPSAIPNDATHVAWLTTR